MEKYHSSCSFPNGCSYNRFVYAWTLWCKKLIGTLVGWMESRNRFTFEYFLWCFRIFTSFQFLQRKKTQKEWNQHLHWYWRQLHIYLNRGQYFHLPIIYCWIWRKSLKTCSFNNGTTLCLHFNWFFINCLGNRYQDLNSLRNLKLNPFIERRKRRITLQCWQCFVKIHSSTSYRKKKFKEKTLILENVQKYCFVLFYSIL